MSKQYTTESGSVYTIDFDKKTWHRFKGINAANLRTIAGVFNSFDDSRGYIHMICPPFNPPYPRVILSTSIIKVEEYVDD